MIPAIRQLVDSYLPGIGRRLREYREEQRVFSRQRPTKYGFTLAGNDALVFGDFESDELALLEYFLQKSDVCIDIGANIGLYSCFAASRGKRVLAIEPLATNLAVLYNNLLANDFANVEVYPVGLSNQPGLRRMYGGGTGASLVPGWAKTAENWNRIVPITTLDLITGTRFDRKQLVIKVDVEGSELELLGGAEHTLGMTPRPFWFVEVCLSEHHPGGRNDHFLETFDLFWRHGYEAFTPDSACRVVRRADVERWTAEGHVDFGCHNYLFAPEHAEMTSTPIA